MKKIVIVGGGSTYTPEHIDEVSRLLGELRGAWAQIRPAVATNEPALTPEALAAAALRRV